MLGFSCQGPRSGLHLRSHTSCPAHPARSTSSPVSSPGNPGAIPNPRPSSSGACSDAVVFSVLLLVVVGMSVSFDHAYTVAMAVGHPGTVKCVGAARRISPLDHLTGAADSGWVCSSIVVRILVPVSPHTVWRGSLPRNPGMVPRARSSVSTNNRGFRRAAPVHLKVWRSRWRSLSSASPDWTFTKPA